MVQQPGVFCGDPRYRAWLVLLVFILVCVILSPIALVVFLFAHRDKLTDGTKSDFRVIYGVLFEPFGHRLHVVNAGWQSVILLRRMIIAIISQASPPAARFMSFAIFGIAIGWLHVWVRPFSSGLTNTMETVGLWLHVLLAVLLGGFESDLQPNSAPPTAVQAVAFLLVAVPGVLMLAAVVKSTFDSLKQTQLQASAQSSSRAEIEIDSGAEYVQMQDT